MAEAKRKITAAMRRQVATLMNQIRNETLSSEERSAIASKAAKAQMKTMTPEQRQERARAAINARWAKAKKGKASK